ncbi:toll/interleukin-1 receptor domain-containing protein [Gordonia alkanivorans]|uniref:toll/interleukin-1 receptor domain-containing protein n=1 Tax=Gordonia alkanivorans TaxID=84096 RepID=UPI003B003998
MVASTTNVPRTCVLLGTSTTSHETASAVAEALRLNGYRVATPEAELVPGSSLLASIQSTIENGDVVVAIISDDTSPTTWVELGIASAFNRPVLVVLAGEVSLSPDLSAFRTIRTSSSGAHFARALQQAVARGTGDRSLQSDTTSTGVELGTNSRILEEELISLPRTPSGASNHQFEDWFSRLLQLARVPFERSGKAQRTETRRPLDLLDFAVSSDELAPNLGDPLPIELILGPADRVLRGRRNTFNLYLTATSARTLLVVSAQDDEPTRLWPNVAGEVLTCSALTLVRRMRSAQFGVAVLSLHNEAVRKDSVS